MRSKTLAIKLICSALSVACLWPALAQDANQDQIDPRAARFVWTKVLPELFAAVPSFTLSKAQQNAFGGTFGIDLSHWEFDINNSDPKCKTAEGYNDPACSCTANWQAVSDNGALYAYSKASDAVSFDLSFPRFWKDLESRHAAKTLFRGAFHFLRPGVDAKKQADAFLSAIGAVNGKKPAQLPPILDIEWSSKIIQPGTPEFNACPQDRRTHQADPDRWLCDTWYTMSASQIAAMARTWIDRVESATGRPVIVYTNPIAWWNPVMGAAGDDLMKRQAVVTSRYTTNGPAYDPNWTHIGGSPTWKMPPLPHGASYPEGSYTTAHSWQFTDKGVLASTLFTCAGKPEVRGMDMNWVPVSGAAYLTLFGVN